MHTSTSAASQSRAVSHMGEQIEAAAQGQPALPLRRAYRLLGKDSYSAAYAFFVKRHPHLINWHKAGGRTAPIMVPVSEIYRFWGLEAPEFVVVGVLAQVMPDGTVHIPDSAAAA